MTDFLVFKIWKTYSYYKSYNSDEDSLNGWDYIANDAKEEQDKLKNKKSSLNILFFMIPKKIKKKETKTNNNIINNNKNKYIQMDKKALDESRNKSEDKYKINVGDINVKAMKEKEGNLIINIK